MQKPEWLKPGLWGALCGAIAMSTVGFSVLGWKSEITADRIASERSDAAVVTALVPFCVAKAEASPDTADMAKLRKEQSSWSRSDIVVKAGWATLNGAKSPDNALARACSDQLIATKAG